MVGSQNVIPERRRYPRVREEVPVNCRVFDDKPIDHLPRREELEWATRISNISLGGVYLEARRQLAPGSILKLSLSPPGWQEPLPAFGEIVWTREEGCGVSFLAMKEEDRERLRAHLAHRITAG